jgi:hypothetical protein
MPAEPEKGGFDYSGMFRELGLKGGAAVVGLLVLCLGLYFAFDYMMGGGLKLPKLGYVTGSVTLDGRPLPGATVYFEPAKDASVEKTKGERPRTSLGTTDDKGEYTMYYIEVTKGVTVGKCRVWLRCMNDKGQSIVPGDFSEANLLVKDVVPGNQKFDFSMKSQP